MIRLNGMLALAACALMATAACGDDETSTTAAGGAGGATTTTTANGGAGGNALDCVQICGDVYTCMVSSTVECPMIDSSTPAAVETDYNAGCLDSCNGPLGPTLAGLVDPNDCDGTLSSLKGANASLKDLCENGPSGAGGSAAGGSSAGGASAGGAGGAGGA